MTCQVKMHIQTHISTKPKIHQITTGFELAICNSRFVKCFSSLQMNFCIFSENCKSLELDTSWIFRVIHWTSYIVSHFKPIKYPLLNNNVISQRFVVHISPTLRIFHKMLRQSKKNFGSFFVNRFCLSNSNPVQYHNRMKQSM